MLENKERKMCISCGGEFTGEEIEEHKESRDCASIAMVFKGP